MNASYEVRGGYLYAKVTGEFTLSNARDILLEGVEEAHSHSLNRALYDITHITGFDARDVSILTRLETSELVAKLLPKDFKLAILESPRQIVEGIFGENVMI